MRSGPLWGALGVVAFSFTVPLTRSSVDHLDPLFVSAGRAAVAAVLAAFVLVAARQPAPRDRQWTRLAVVAVGVVVGFPVLTSYAVTMVPASHAAVVIALLPAATAVVAVLRTGERPGCRFWLAAAAGALAGVMFVVSDEGGWHGVHWADLLLLAAVVAAAVGYAEGGLLARELGSWQTISWALLVGAPVTIALTILSLSVERPSGTTGDWLGFAYLAVVSMFLGFFAWYRGLAIGPMAQVSQVQLVQPVLTIVWAAILLGERVEGPTVVAAGAVVFLAATAVRSRLAEPAAPPIDDATRPG